MRHARFSQIGNGAFVFYTHTRIEINLQRSLCSDIRCIPMYDCNTYVCIGMSVNFLSEKIYWHRGVYRKTHNYMHTAATSNEARHIRSIAPTDRENEREKNTKKNKKRKFRENEKENVRRRRKMSTSCTLWRWQQHCCRIPITDARWASNVIV